MADGVVEITDGAVEITDGVVGPICSGVGEAIKVGEAINGEAIKDMAVTNLVGTMVVVVALPIVQLKKNKDKIGKVRARRFFENF